MLKEEGLRLNLRRKLLMNMRLNGTRDEGPAFAMLRLGRRGARDYSASEVRLPHAPRPTPLVTFFLLISSFLLLPSALLRAFPPAPHHTIYGQVRDELGNPITAAEAEVIFLTESGQAIVTPLSTTLPPGRNYRLRIPIDAGLTTELYTPTAMRPTMPFTMHVRIGREVFLPIEINTFGSASMGQPGKTTRLDLTLGEDSDGDGIPDAWERSLINRGFADDLNGVRPEDDADGDGLTNLQEYLAGSYAYDNENGFALDIKRVEGESPVLEFLAVRGRSYRVLGSTDLGAWEEVGFKLATDDPEAGVRGVYHADDVRTLEIEVPRATNAPVLRFFKLMVQ